MNLQNKSIVYKKRANRIQYKLKKKNKEDYPRIAFRCSLKHLYAQLIDDSQNKTIFSVSTNSSAFLKDKNQKKSTFSNREFAAKLAVAFLEKLKIQKKIGDNFVFDRGGKKYQGKVKVFADELRKNKLAF